MQITAKRVNQKFGKLSALSILVFIFLSLTVLGQKNDVNYRVINIGNLANLKNLTEYTAALKQFTQQQNVPTLLLINGDITHPNNSPYLGKDSLPLFEFFSQLSDLPNISTIVIPGDSDWDNSGKYGLDKVKNLEELVEYDGFKRVKWIADKGCPGPEVVELDSNLLLMVINTQWWNHPYKKPEVVQTKCDINTEKDFIIEIENTLAEAENKNLIIAGHFPLVEQGNLPLSSHLKPFPIYGSFKTYYHQNIGGKKDIINERFNPIREKILKRMSLQRGIVYFSGHEYNTQVIKEHDNYFINNGVTDKKKKGRTNRFAAYSTTLPSISEVVYFTDGSIINNNYTYKNTVFELHKTLMLFKSLLDNSAENETVPSNFSNKDCLKDVSATVFPESLETMKTNAGNYEASKFRKLIIGKHYRTSWNAFIDVPVLNMDTTKGGLTAYDIGGGHQTTSVKMYGNDGYAYTFRSVNKDATRYLSVELQNSLVARQLQDNISMQHPYASIVVGKLLDYTSILHAKPELYLLSENPKLGIFNKYNGMLGTLEDHQKNPKKVKHSFANADFLLQSYELNQKLYDKPNHTVDANEYLKARVFDILVGDHGKHQDNWKWAGFKTDTGVYYLPVPRDRDLVFKLWDGIIPWLLDRKWGVEAGENFGYKINDVKSLMFIATAQDRFLTNQMTRKDWTTASHYIQQQLTDTIIEASTKVLPSEIYELSGKTIADKLKTRKKDLDSYAEKYYRLLAKQVDVIGTNEKDFFEVTRNENGTVDVAIYSEINTEIETQPHYHRKFIPTETKEIRIYGLGSKDVFTIKGNSKKSIPIIVVGGNGEDAIIDSSAVKTFGKQTKIYEKSIHKNSFLGTESKKINSWNDDLYDFQPNRFKYNRYMPLFSMGYSADNGFGIGGGVIFTNRENYKNTDYTTKHKLNLSVSTEQNNIFEYNSRFRHVLHKWDLSVGGLLAKHNNITNFYGIGNNTINNDSVSSEEFYKTTFDTYSANIGLIREFRKKSHFFINVEGQHNSVIIKENTILSPTSEQNFSTADNNIIVSSFGLDLDFRDRSNLPEKGIRLVMKYQNGQVSSNNSSYNIATGFLEHYLSVRLPSPITLATKVGGSVSEGDIPFYNRIYLGSNNNLRGYRKNRFTGKHSIFMNNEVRLQLVNFTTTFLPMKMGIKAFFDTGRIIDDSNVNNQWHTSYGAGIYWGFLDEQFTLNISLAHSVEENNFLLFSLGKSFN